MTQTLPPPSMVGLLGVKLPVRDIEQTTRWYAQVFGWARAFEFSDEDGRLVGVGGRLPGRQPAGLSFRRNPEAHPQAGLELGLAIATKTDLERWVEHLDRHRVPHTPIIDATISWLVVLHDPDGHEIHLITREEHGLDQTGRPGYGRRPAGIDVSLPSDPGGLDLPEGTRAGVLEAMPPVVA
jgi:catechol 2,3-dioxygenase-like lactoylglutathione lyase family enzyme